MPAPKKPENFDAHLGTVISNLARKHGGREFIARLIGTSVQTINRRVIGQSGFTVRDLEVIAPKLNTTPQLLIDQALRDYGDGDREVGYEKLCAEYETLPAANVGALDEDDYEVTPGDAHKADLALAANQRPKKVDTPHAE